MSLLIVAALTIYFLFGKKISSRKVEFKLMGVILVAFFISLLPVIHLETSFVGSSQSDRYGYLPTVFFVITIAMIFVLINRKVFAISVSCFLTVWFFVDVENQNSNWIKASALVKKIVNEFKPADGTCYITNIPDNYNGAYILRNGLSDAASVINKKKFCTKNSGHFISDHYLGKRPGICEKISVSEYLVTFAERRKKFLRSEKIFTAMPIQHVILIQMFQILLLQLQLNTLH
jgi:hypothetical protein